MSEAQEPGSVRQRLVKSGLLLLSEGYDDSCSAAVLECVTENSRF